MISLSLRDIPLKQWYDSDEDDILTDFLIPTLSNSIKYDRLVGFFSSSCLAVAARGILPFIKNQGKMRIITSPKFSQQDIIEIEKSVDK